jgi:membrane-associated phospholipid phosphatase
MITLFLIQKGDGILWLNRHNTSFLDIFFRNATKMGEELAFFLALVALLFFSIRKAIYIPLIGLLVTIFSFFLKAVFGYPRPSVYFKQQGIYEELSKVDFVHIVGGNTSFPSGHTMAGFALFMYLAFCVKSNTIKFLFLTIAILVGISRMYLLQHFLEDVFFGSLWGVIVAIGVYYLQESTLQEKSFLDLPIHKLSRRNKKA